MNVYRQSLAGRYPMSPGSARDATLDDFGQFFGVGGVMDNYFRKYLQPYVDTSAQTLALAAGRGRRNSGLRRVCCKPSSARRRSAMRSFAQGGTQPIVRFELKPVAMDASITPVPARPRRPAIELRPRPEPPGGDAMAEPRQHWRGAYFDHAAVGQRSFRRDPGRPVGLVPPAGTIGPHCPAMRRTASNLRLRVDGASIAYELRANSAFNPFKSRVLSGFSLPERL